MSESALTIAAALAKSKALAAVSDTPELDLQLLLADLLAKPRSYLYTWPERTLDPMQLRELERRLARRLQGEPVAHILGCQGFWTLELEVSPATLIPRPETELLVELALTICKAEAMRVADLGTGTGAIALALANERPSWQVDAVEFSRDAQALAERNRQRLGLSNVRILPGSWCDPLEGAYQLILSNPPYIDAADPHLKRGDLRFEPLSALVADEMGLADLRQIAEGARSHLSPGGWLLLEHGYQQGSAVRQLLTAQGYSQVRTERDLGERDRVTLGQWR